MVIIIHSRDTEWNSLSKPDAWDSETIRYNPNYPWRDDQKYVALRLGPVDFPLPLRATSRRYLRKDNPIPSIPVVGDIHLELCQVILRSAFFRMVVGAAEARCLLEVPDEHPH